MMMDFAKYAFNKSHAACYAVVAYQTAYLKYYYPVEFMAALMTSVIDNPKKVSEYILNCRNMNIAILPPDVNAGEAGFSVTDGKIRYALTAIKGVGRPVIDSLVQERKERGPFTNLKDFITRMSDKKEMNKRAIENLIKAGAMDGLGGTRKQFMSVYVQIADHIAHDKKNNLPVLSGHQLPVNFALSASLSQPPSNQNMLANIPHLLPNYAIDQQLYANDSP